MVTCSPTITIRLTSLPAAAGAGAGAHHLLVLVGVERRRRDGGRLLLGQCNLGHRGAAALTQPPDPVNASADSSIFHR